MALPYGFTEPTYFIQLFQSNSINLLKVGGIGFGVTYCTLLVLVVTSRILYCYGCLAEPRLISKTLY